MIRPVASDLVRRFFFPTLILYEAFFGSGFFPSSLCRLLQFYDVKAEAVFSTSHLYE